MGIPSGISTYSAKHESGDSVRNAEMAARDIRERAAAAGAKPAQIVFFAAGNYDPARLAAAMREAFPGAVTFGSGALGNGGALRAGRSELVEVGQCSVLH